MKFHQFVVVTHRQAQGRLFRSRWQSVTPWKTYRDPSASSEQALKVTATNLSVFLLFISSLILSSAAQAQWASDSTTNTPVCTLSGSQHTAPKICSDGSDGAIIVWQDTRNGSSNIYAQRLDAEGVPHWTANGVRLCTPRGTNATQEDPIVASDGSGGAYVVWEDLRNTVNGIDLYGQHVRSDGTLAASDTGIAVCASRGDQTGTVICPDGAGGAFVTWTDDRPTSPSTYAPDIYMNRLSGGSATLGRTGSAVYTGPGIQRLPALVSDGAGGCYIAWEDGASLPYGIRANHVSAGGSLYWGANGFLVYRSECGSCFSANSSHVSIRLDEKQLMLAWEVSSVTGNGQNIMAARIRCNNAYDSTQVWGQAIEVTGDMPFDQMWPQIFSDDSATAIGSDNRGILVVFEYAWPGAADDWNITMIRMLGDGITQLPSPGTVYPLTQQPHGQVGFQAIPIDSASFLAAWNDARFSSGPDTCVYAQMMDKSGNRFFPSYKTRSTWGLPICHRTTTAKQVEIAPRTNGAIMAWTDYRAGTNQANIYAQVLFRDGSLPIELENFSATCPTRGEVELSWKTASEHSNAGFELERSPVTNGNEGAYATIASYQTESALRGAGTSSTEHDYAWVDRSVPPAIYDYRLVEVALDGRRTVHDAVQGNAGEGSGAQGWSLGPNQPNPFFESTTVPMTLPTSAIVNLVVYDVTGRTVAIPIANKLLPAGSQFVTLDANAFKAAAGTYFLRMTATDPTTGELLWQSAQPVMLAP